MLSQVTIHFSSLACNTKPPPHTLESHPGHPQEPAHARIDCHEKQIRANDQKNSMAQHLSQHHPAQVRNKDVFSFKVMTTGERPLTRQLREAQKIANDIPSGQLINGRNEHIAPAFQQLAPADILGRDRAPGNS